MLKIFGEHSSNNTARRQQKKSSKPSFGHHVLTSDSKGEKVYKINLPNAPKGTQVELMPFYYADDGTFHQLQTKPVVKDMPEGFASITVTKNDLPLTKDYLLGYRFKVNGKVYHDYTLFNGVNNINRNTQYNMAVPVNHPGHSVPRQMVHIFPDSFNANTREILSQNGVIPEEVEMSVAKNYSNVRRTPFNHLGGTINGIREKLPKLKEFGARGILACPITGGSNVSSHGYWTENPYQVTENLGTLNDFKALMLDINKNGMHWVNDGAYVNEGLQGIHIGDIITWRNESPFVYQFETKNLDNEKLSLGIRPRSKELDKHIKAALINAPYKVVFEKNQNGGFDDREMVKNPDFNPAKPTYVQIFNDEMVLEEQLNSDKPFNVYGRKMPADKRKYYEKKDSTPAMYFRVSPTEVERNYNKYKHSKTGAPKDFLMSWKNYEIVPANKDGGAALWVGNTDIAKRRFMLPESALVADEAAGNTEKVEKMIAGQYQTQSDIVQVGKYWTYEVQRLLLEYTANQLAEKISHPKTLKDAAVSLIYDNKISEKTENELKSKAFENAVNSLIQEEKLYKILRDFIKAKTDEGKDYKTAVEELIWEDKIPKEKADLIYAKITDGDAYEKAVETFINEKKLNDETVKAIKSLEGTEVSYSDAIKQLIWENKIPEFSKLALEKGADGATPLENILKFNTDGKRDYKLSTAVMPENITDGIMSFPFESIEFAPDLSTVFAYPYIKNLAVTEEYVGKSRYEMYKDGEKYYSLMPADYREVYKKADSIIAGKMSVKANEIMHMLDDEDKFDGILFDEKGNLTQDGKEIYALIAPDIARFLVISALAPALRFKEQDGFFTYDIKNLREISLESLNLQFEDSPKSTAEKLLQKLDEGLGNITEKKRSFLVEYLYKRLKNLDSDTINVAKLLMEKSESGLDWRIDAAKDVGDWDSVERNLMSSNEAMSKTTKFWQKFNDGVYMYNPKKYNIGELTRDIAGDWNWMQKEVEFIGKGGFTTQSNYQHLHSSPFRAYSVISEAGGEFGQRTNNMDELVQKILYNNGEYAMLYSGFLDNINFSHLFVGNHDKPRVLHMLALNALKFKDDKAEAMQEALLERGHLQDCADLPNDCKAAIRDAVIRLASGVYTEKDGKLRTYDAENFGAAPFDINLDDVIEEAKNASPLFKDYISAHPNEAKKIKVAAFKDIILPAMDVYKAMLFMFTVMPGVPTNYIGDEMGETGWETPSKNEKQQNRNRIHWEWLSDKDYEWLKNKRREIGDIFNIRNQPAASPLVNGSLVPLAPQTHNASSDGNVAAAFYRYNDKTDAVCVLHNSGYGEQTTATDKTRYIDCISLEQHGAAPYGLPLGLPKGTEYYNALNPAERYVVSDNGREIVKKDGSKICIGSYGLVLLRVKDFNGNDLLKRDISFKGRPQNPYVTLANLKFNLPVQM